MTPQASGGDECDASRGKWPKWRSGLYAELASNPFGVLLLVCFKLWRNWQREWKHSGTKRRANRQGKLAQKGEVCPFLKAALGLESLAKDIKYHQWLTVKNCVTSDPVPVPALEWVTIRDGDWPCGKTPRRTCRRGDGAPRRSRCMCDEARSKPAAHCQDSCWMWMIMWAGGKTKSQWGSNRKKYSLYVYVLLLTWQSERN